MATNAHELAVAYVSLAVSGRDLRKQIDEALGQSAAPAEKQSRTLGDRIMGGIGGAMKKGAIVAGAGVAGVLGTSLVKGFSRLNAIDQAESKLRGLGHSADGVKGIMDNALASVKGTAFGLGEAATTAAGAVAAGIKPGQDLERVLKLTGDTATIAGSSMGEMGSIFNKVAASNRLSMAEVNQLSDRGVPIMQMLADQYGVTAAEARKMVEKGQVDFADFSQAIEDNIGGAALESGDTFQGALANMGAALGRLGASLLGGVFPQIKDGFGDITGALDNLGPVAEKVGEKVGAALAWMVDAGKGLFDLFVKGDFSESFRKAFNIEEDSGVVGFLLGLRETAIDTFNEIKGGITAFAAAWKANDGDVTSSGFPGFMERLANVLRKVFGFMKDTAIPALMSLGKWLIDNKETVLAFVGVIAGFAVIQKVISWVKAARVAVLAFNAALRANPIGLIVTAIALLVAGLVWLYNNNETARRIIDAAWAAIKTAISAVVSWLTDTAWPFIKKVWDAISSGAKWLWEKAIKPAWEGIKSGISTVVDWLRNTAWPWIKDVWDKISAGAKWLWEKAIKPAWEGIKKGIEVVVTWLKDTAWPWIKDVWDKVAAGAQWLWENGIKPAWDNIKRGISTVVDWLKDTAWPFIKDVWDKIAAGATWLWDNGIKPAFDNIKKGIDVVVDAFGKAKDGIGRAWDKLKDVVAGPIRAAIGWINDYFIRPINKIFEALGLSFSLPTINVSGGGSSGVSSRGGPMLAMADGGTVPGWSPHARADNIPAMLTAGEFILPVRSTARLLAQVGHAGLEMLRRGILPGFADGGFVSDAWDWLKETGSHAFDWAAAASRAITDPLGTLKRLVATVVPGDSFISKIATQTLPKILDGAVAKLKELVAKLVPSTGAGWEQIWARVQSIAPEATRTSDERRGARTAGSGAVSMHAMGRAIDVVSDDLYGLHRKIAAALGTSPTELIGPITSLNISRGTHRFGTVTNPVTLRGHKDHVHVAYADGGFVKPFVADRGVTLAPGINVLNNKLGRPEPLARTDQPVRLHPEDLRAFAAAVERGAYRGVSEIGRGLALAGGGY